MNKREIKYIKQDYKILRENDNLTYLNSAATTLKPDFVIDTLNEMYLRGDTTFEKSIIKTGPEGNVEMFINTIERVAKHINASKSDVVATYGTTDFINKIARQTISEMSDGDEIILGKLEHSANTLPWIYIAKELNKKINFKWYELKDWKIDLDHLETIVSEKTKLISIAHIYNTTGAKNDIEKLRTILGSKVKIVVDGAQAIGHTKIDVKLYDIDYYVFGAHKAFGPHALGFAYVKNLDNLKNPWNYGGGNNISYDENKIVYKEGRSKFMTGTRDVPGVVAFSTAISYIESFGMEEIEKYNQELKKYAEERLSNIKGVRIMNKGVKSSILFFEVSDIAGEDVAYQLSKDGIVLRSGSSCVKWENDYYKQYKSLRASFHIYNTKEDIDKLYNSLVNGGDFLDALFEKRPVSPICK